MGSYYSFDCEKEEALQTARERRRMHKARVRRHKIIMMIMVMVVIAMFVGANVILYAFEDEINQNRGENQIEDIEADTEIPDREITDTVVQDQVVRDWRTTLVNKWNPMEGEYSGNLIQLVRGQSIDERCYPELQQMLDDCQAAGYRPIITSSYRTQEKQERLFRNQVQILMGQGFSEQEAKEEAGTVVAVPGTSEHQLGLAVDIISEENHQLDESQEKTGTQRWLMENSWKYGFILRYPNGKSDITGIIYEPWHYRYVGKEVAKEIYERNICLEEYLGEVVQAD